MEEKIALDDSEIERYIKFRNKMQFLKLSALVLVLLVLFVRFVFLPIVNIFLG
tara:strand:+ start:5385 stop:5543 length:159 start_codon:yes stop_codon:yes gene_type:complete